MQSALLRQASQILERLGLPFERFGCRLGLFLCLLSIRRYNYLLMRAECLAEQSVCAQ